MKTFYEVVYPGKGYRLLNIGEVIKEGDEVSLSNKSEDGMSMDRSWQKVKYFKLGKVNEPSNAHIIPYGYYRRKLPIVKKVKNAAK